MNCWSFTASSSRASTVTMPPVSALNQSEIVLLIKCSGKPGMFDLKGRYKWDAWSKNKGMSREEAQAKYIAHVEFLKTKYA